MAKARSLGASIHRRHQSSTRPRRQKRGPAPEREPGSVPAPKTRARHHRPKTNRESHLSLPSHGYAGPNQAANVPRRLEETFAPCNSTLAVDLSLSVFLSYCIFFTAGLHETTLARMKTP